MDEVNGECLVDTCGKGIDLKKKKKKNPLPHFNISYGLVNILSNNVNY